jgi:hypothetical protein
MRYLLITLSVVAVLVVLYLVSRKVKPFGQSLGFVAAVLGRVLVKIAEYTGKASDYSNKACIASLKYPPGVSNIDYWHGVLVISRLVILLLAGTVLSAEPVNTILVLPALYQTASTIHFPGIVELASAALFIAAPALWGCALFEVWGLIPHGCGMFPRLGTLTRWVLGIVSGVFLILAILVTGYLYIFRAVYLLSPDSTQGMSLYILGGLGLLTAGSAVLAFWAFVVGVLGAVSLIAWVGEMIARTLSAIASLPVEQLDTLALHLSGGTVGVKGEQIERDPHQYPSLFANTPNALPPGRTSVVELPEHAVSVVDAEIEVVPIETPALEETTTMNPDKNAFIGFVGSFGSRIYPHAVQAIDRLHATESIFCSYFLERSHTHVNTSIKDIRDLSHTVAEKNLSMLHGATEDEGDHTLLCDLSHKIAESYHPLMAIPSPFVHCIDCYDLVNSIDLLEATKRRNSLISQVVVTSVSEHDWQNKGVQVGLSDVIALQQEGFLDTMLLVAPDADFARSYGEDTELKFLAQKLISLIIAHQHDPHNPSFSNVFRHMGSLSPLTTVSFASQVVAVGQMPRRWSWFPMASGSSGTGYYSDILSQAREATDRVLLEEDTRAFPSHVQSDAGCYVIYNVPIELRDPRFSSCVRDNNLYVSSHYPFASSITVRGNGMSYPHQLGGRFMVSAGCLYPLQPASFPMLQGVRNTKVTQLFPVSTALEPAKENGNMPVDEKQKAKPTKAVTTTRQKKVAGSTRRVVRKSTKQQAK